VTVAVFACGLPAWYKRCISSGILSTAMSTGPGNRLELDLDAYHQYILGNPRDGCPRIYGPSVCKLKLGKQCLRLVTLIHRRIWAWMKRLWLTNEMEGQLLVRFKASSADVSKTIVAMLCRRYGNPYRMIFCKLRRASFSAQQVRLYNIGNMAANHATSFELALQLVSIFGVPAPPARYKPVGKVSIAECKYRDISLSSAAVQRLTCCM
jgi:hypothetical protein